MVCWWWTPCSCASNDSLPNTQLSLTDLDLVERWFEWKASWGRLEIKIHMVGMEYLGLNTWVGGSLSENECWSVGMFWWLSLLMKEGWRGIYSLHTKSNRYTQFTKVGGTESENSVRPIQFKMWTLGFSVGPVLLGLGHNIISARPITQTRWNQFW